MQTPCWINPIWNWKFPGEKRGGGVWRQGQSRVREATFLVLPSPPKHISLWEYSVASQSFKKKSTAENRKMNAFPVDSETSFYPCPCNHPNTELVPAKGELIPHNDLKNKLNCEGGGGGIVLLQGRGGLLLLWYGKTGILPPSPDASFTQQGATQSARDFFFKVPGVSEKGDRMERSKTFTQKCHYQHGKKLK